MDYEQKYKEALKRARLVLQERGNEPDGASILSELFPELKESEDEKIRKKIIQLVNDAMATNAPYKKEMLAWLEKQGKENPLKGTLVEVFDDLKLGIDPSPKQCEQKPADKVEPKFHEGDWVVSPNGVYWHIDAIRNSRYQVSSESGNCAEWPLDTNIYHKFTIQDVKDGDVLVADNKCPFIYRVTTVFENPVAYCGVRSDDVFISESPTNHQWCLKNEVMPATKEQCDLLFQKMKEAGYEWDADKKELKKIEQKLVEATISEDLEEAANKYESEQQEKHKDRDNHDFNNYRNGFTDGLTFTYDAFKAGAQWKEKQMIKQSLPADVKVNRYDNKYIATWAGLVQYNNYNIGDKVKVIIIKDK